LLDSLAGAAGQMMQNNGQNGHPLVESVLQTLSNGSAQGGLEGLVQQFSQAGLGHIVQSWIGGGANLPVSADQLQQALGDSHLSELAQKLGTSPSEISGQLAQVLPGLVDKLTPNGQLPQGGVQDALGALGGLGALGSLFGR